MPVNRKITNAATVKYPLAIHRRTLLNLAIVGLLLYVVVPASTGLGESMSVIKGADPVWVAAAAASIALSYGFAALTYKLLAIRPIRYLPTLSVQIAGGFVNRLLPAGIGGLGLNLLYLKKARHPVTAATAVVGTNNTIGAVGNILLISCALAIDPRLLQSAVSLRLPSALPLVGSLIMLAVILTVIARNRVWRARSEQFAGQTFKSLGQYMHRPGTVAAALLSSMSLTALHVAGLYFVALALGLDISVVMALLAISVGAFVGAAVPTPGGLGGAEAGIAAALIAFGIPSIAAFGAAILYRTITFWAPLLPGFIMFRIVQRKYI